MVLDVRETDSGALSRFAVPTEREQTRGDANAPNENLLSIHEARSDGAPVRIIGGHKRWYGVLAEGVARFHAPQVRWFEQYDRGAFTRCQIRIKALTTSWTGSDS